jgi:3',5'-cyclic-nucleotide phosphodiesterase
MILTDEFSRQAAMEQDLGIPTALFAAPVREIVELGKSQIGFMNMFALPLFQGVTDVMPGMEYCVDELQQNKSRWEEKIAEEQARARQDSTDSQMMDGMFSPRSMSIATPSDASHQKPGSAMSAGRSNTDSNLRIKAMLNKSPFAQSKHLLDESWPSGHHQSLPEFPTNQLDPDPSTNASPQGSPETIARLSSKPGQLQLSYATASAPGHLDHPSQDNDLVVNGDGEPHFNGIEVQPSLVTDPVVVDPSTPDELSKSKVENQQRTSDTTDSNNSAADWTSQATSATTNKMPLSPSTQGTSIMSEDMRDSLEKGLTLTNASPIPRDNESNTDSTTSTSTSTTPGKTDEAGVVDDRNAQDSKGALKETVRNLKKKPSRFRMNSLKFWERSKSSSPPMPGRERRIAIGSSEDEGTSSH